METKDKELLFKDLCSRIPYGVKFATKYESHKNNIYELIAVNKHCETVETFGAIWWNIEDIKPYLRPMSSMTEEEEKEFSAFFSPADCIDWLNANHFDYRGLIPMGLGIEAKEGMYDFK